jgi:large subunit ribosomal protein L15
MKLNELKPKDGAFTRRERVGRGIGSGKGKEGGRGTKGQKARDGVNLNGFEGGQIPMHRRVPKRGFNNIFAAKPETVSLRGIQQAIDKGKLDAKQTIDEAALVSAGIVRRAPNGIKLLGNGELNSAVNLRLSQASKSAKSAVEKAGGSVETNNS